MCNLSNGARAEESGRHYLVKGRLESGAVSSMTSVVAGPVRGWLDGRCEVSCSIRDDAITGGWIWS